MLQLARLDGVTFYDPDFGKPLANAHVGVGSGWGLRDDRMHHGIDIGVPVGTSVVAVGPGTVIRVKTTDTDDAGINVAIQHGNGMTSRYLHLSRTLVALGQQVARGQLLGKSGNTGRSSGPHLHFELRADPVVLADIERAVGKPRTGWGGRMDPYGIAIPSEPWIPVDEIRTSTIDADRRNGVTLYQDRKRVEAGRAYASSGWGPAMLGLGVLGAGAVSFLWLSSLRASPGRRRGRWGI